jgi:hypothetical protein
MKSTMNTAFLTLSLFAIGLNASAQPATATTTNQSLEALAPMAPLAATIAGNGTYYFSDKEIKAEDLKSKEVSKEISVNKGADIYIENASRGIVVKTWDQNRVKVTTTVYCDGESKLTDEEWLERVNLSLKTLGTSVKIKSGTVGSNNGVTLYTTGQSGYSFGTAGGVAVFNGTGQNIGVKSNLKRVVTITVPAGSKLDIESKYSEVQLPAGIGDVNVDISNGNLEAENLNKLVLRSKYSNANVGDVKTAELEFNNGRFSAKNIDDLDIESKYSTIEMAAAKKLVLRSTNDEYEIEDAGEVRGRKNYGNLRITRLTSSLDIEGLNADVKVRNVGPNVSLIKLDDKYADIRIPLREIKDYGINFAGAYSSVYGNFEKVPVQEAAEGTEASDKKEKEKSKAVAGTSVTVPGNLSPVIVNGSRFAPMAAARTGVWVGQTSNGPARFTAAVGSGKGLKIDMKCMNCTVDFK